MSTPSLSHPRRHGRHELSGGGVRLLGVALLGGALALVLALATGALHTGARVTTVVEPAPATMTGAAARADLWSAVYARTAPGTVDVTAQVTTSVPTPEGAREQQTTASGSGVVLDGSGRILTAAHVVQDAGSVDVAFTDGATRTATVVGRDDGADVALLRVDPAGLTLHPLALGSSSGLAVGQPVAVLGDALGFDRSLSTGVVSGVGREIQAPSGVTIANAVQTDAAMNPGNSGGPVLDARGRVIGIADQIATGPDEFGRSGGETSTGVGFAVPIDLAKAAVAHIEQANPST